jgi:hypothetical protein
VSYSSLHRAALAALLLTGGAAWSGGHAAGICSGILQTSLLHPLPKPLTVGSQRSIADTTNPQLSQRFADGMQQAGVVLSEQANTTLSVAVSVSAQAGSGLASGSFKGFDWTSGMVFADGHTPNIRSSTLTISAVLSDNAAYTQSWVATIGCKVQTDDPGELAQFIGNVLGKVIGQNLDRRTI